VAARIHMAPAPGSNARLQAKPLAREQVDWERLDLLSAPDASGSWRGFSILVIEDHGRSGQGATLHGR